MIHQIIDINGYLSRMQKSVLDKMFFMDKVFEPFSTVVDFGCANGELIKALQSLFGEYRYVGYDLSEDMIAAAKLNTFGAEYYSCWDDIDVNFTDSLLNVSSTIHEVYSYGTDADVELFWNRVFLSGFKYISIRDMMLSEKEKDYIDGDLQAAAQSNELYKGKLSDFESVWGPIGNQYNLVHYLLKYKYDHNWEREVRENYVPLTFERLHNLIPENYEITYESHFTLPYISWQIEKDFNVKFNTPTHVKLILKRKL